MIRKPRWCINYKWYVTGVAEAFKKWEHVCVRELHPKQIATFITLGITKICCHWKHVWVVVD